ncbi:MAG: 50S ribosomal protein L20 [bacterium]|nr:50S ribosomal protein L20 [bacterium]
MPRVKRGTTSRKRHKRLFKATKGYTAGRTRSVRRATEARLHARKHAYKHRRLKKRQFRSLWIVRINNGLREHGSTYSTFIKELKVKGILLDRKALAYLAAEQPKVFAEVVKQVIAK